MKKVAFAALVLTLALPLYAQTPEPVPPPVPAPEPAPAQAPPPEPEEKPKSSLGQRWFFGGGVGASFGDVDYVAVSPLVGFRATKRLDVGVQPFFRWTDDGRYSPKLETTDYGASVFARVRVIGGLFAEVDYQLTSYEFPEVSGGTSRDTYDSFLAGAGYSFPIGGHVGFYVSALYDFSYDDTIFQPYDSPVRVQVGVAVGF